MTRHEIDQFIRVKSREREENSGDVYLRLYNEFGKRNNMNLWFESNRLEMSKMKVLEHYNLLDSFAEYVKWELS